MKSAYHQTVVKALRARRAKRGLAAIAAVIVSLGVVPAWSAAVLGTAVGVLPAAVAQLGGQEVTILRGDQLLEGQTIVTGAMGEVQIVFVDDTRMVIGPSSTLVIQTILMRNSTSFASLVTDAVGGTFRFITGNSSHDAYTMNTPAGTIAVRGTAYDLTIEPISNRVDVVVYVGGVELCPPGGRRCVVVDEECSVGNLANNGAAVIRREGERQAIAVAQFPYAHIQAGLLDDFRVPGARACTELLTEAPPVEAPAVIPVVLDVQPGPPPPPPESGPPPASDPPEPVCASGPPYGSPAQGNGPPDHANGHPELAPGHCR